jgi:hypothetical protein
MASANFTPIPATPTFGQKQQNYYASDYIANKKIKNIFCNREQCLKLNKVNSENELMLLNKAIRYNTFIKRNTANLNNNLYTKLDLKDVNVLETNTNPPITPTTINTSSLFNTSYTIDPNGSLFGNTECGINNYVNYQVNNCS